MSQMQNGCGVQSGMLLRVCREVLLSSVNVGVLASLFTFGAAPRPSNLGVQVRSSMYCIGTYGLYRNG